MFQNCLKSMLQNKNTSNEMAETSKTPDTAVYKSYAVPDVFSTLVKYKSG